MRSIRSTCRVGSTGWIRRARSRIPTSGNGRRRSPWGPSIPAYGHEFRYDEAVLTGEGAAGFAKAAALAAGTAMVMGALAIAPIRNLVLPLLPKPGEGPSRETQQNGYFEITLLGLNPEDPEGNVRATVKGDRDPGYGSTAKMLAESAVCLAMDELDVGGGFWTPASAMGMPLIERLGSNAGVTFTLD